MTFRLYNFVAILSSIELERYRQFIDSYEQYVALPYRPARPVTSGWLGHVTQPLFSLQLPTL